MTEQNAAPLWALDDNDDITYRGAPVFKVYREHDFPCLEDEDRATVDAEALANASAVVALLNGPARICGAWWRLGATAMRDAIVDRITRQWPGPAAQIAADAAIPVVPERQLPAGGDWAWYAGVNDEWYACGPHGTRDEALSDARASLPSGDSIYLIEARTGTINIDAEDVIDRAMERASEDLFDCEHAEPERTGSADDINAADEELQEILNGWLDRHRHTFNRPNMFASTRNAEVVPAEALAA